jgi:hypothetical protein
MADFTARLGLDCHARGEDHAGDLAAALPALNGAP